MSHRKEVAALLPIAKARGLRAAKFDEAYLPVSPVAGRTFCRISVHNIHYVSYLS